ncbi:hypothetical protein SY27_15295 [Flavobacterium sp. 316]|uniref:AAA family ATPase n=1 Tax=Flavobacterium sp. 316 TaxID=1603293 RepID=UPI0005DC9E20|nr:AAA family ATPase [Flavobacterium sp. 316]KIX19896.1 hypothetical protein SY27_15295 [Flavobacterium sp. 316]
MKINKISFQNFRIYKGVNTVYFDSDSSKKNISIIAGKNGYGKTTFLTALIWGFYGKMMGEVEDKYRKDIKNAGGYDSFLKTLINRDFQSQIETNQKEDFDISVEIELIDLSIQPFPCETVLIKRSYNFKKQIEQLTVLIDGIESELSNVVGNEVFINDFILPREIAKFFFFDAEKIVSLAEAKSKQELRNLSKAYSEVLGIKKYEDLKKNLETLLSKYKREGASIEQKNKLSKLIQEEKQISELISLTVEEQQNLEKEITTQKLISDNYQEKLIREGNGITLSELQELKEEKEYYKTESVEIKNKLKKLLDIAPLVIAGKQLENLRAQLLKESESQSYDLGKFINSQEFDSFSKLFISNLKALSINEIEEDKLTKVIKETFIQQNKKEILVNNPNILIDFDEEQLRHFEAIYNNIKTTFSSQFNEIIKLEKNNRLLLSRVQHKIKQAEARTNNPVAQTIRKNKEDIDKKINKIILEKEKLIERVGGLKTQLASIHKALSTIEKEVDLDETESKKYTVIEELQQKISKIITTIKQEKKYSLQKSFLFGLKKIMHKENFIEDVKISVSDDIMDIELFDKNNLTIEKDSLSKGEQQLYATALLKALVDESGIKFPVFIDSPLQKFDKYHSKSIITEFYPNISEQVVLFPLLEKELSKEEYNYLKPNVNKIYSIENDGQNSTFKELEVEKLFDNLKSNSYV